MKMRRIFMDSIYVVMPAYNEEENIRKTVKQWYPVLDGKIQADNCGQWKLRPDA